MRHSFTAPFTCCVRCEAEKDKYVTRMRSNKRNWSSDLKLAYDLPKIWHYPTKTTLNRDGFCKACVPKR